MTGSHCIETRSGRNDTKLSCAALLMAAVAICIVLYLLRIFAVGAPLAAKFLDEQR